MTTDTMRAAVGAMTALFRENAIPMSDRNGRLHDTILAALEEGGEPSAATGVRNMERIALSMALIAWKNATTEEWAEEPHRLRATLDNASRMLAASTAAPKEEGEPSLAVLNALEVLERMGYDAEHLATAATFLMVLGERGMWVIENPLATSPIAAAVEWVGADGTRHEITLDYAAQIAKWMFDTHGDVPQVDAVLAADTQGDAKDAAPLHQNHLPDLRYVLKVLQGAHVPERQHGDVQAAIKGMRYIIKRTEEATEKDGGRHG